MNYSDEEVSAFITISLYHFLDTPISKESIDNTQLDNNDEDFFMMKIFPIMTFLAMKFSYYDKIDRFSDLGLDYYWNYNLYYNPWDLHYYNYHGINSFNWPYYNGWGMTNYFGLGWGHYGLGWGHYGLGWGHYGLGWDTTD